MSFNVQFIFNFFKNANGVNGPNGQNVQNHVVVDKEKRHDKVSLLEDMVGIVPDLDIKRKAVIHKVVREGQLLLQIEMEVDS